MAGEGGSTVSKARTEANAWVARFAPLVMDSSLMDEKELRMRLATVDQLRHSVPDTFFLKSSSNVQDIELIETLGQANSQLDSIEDDLRRRLARLVPGDPEGKVDLDALQDRLAERAARQEIGVRTDLEVPEVLEMKTGSGSWAAAGFLTIFASGWTAFTTVHAILMIGGMWSAFGPLAIALLLFYAIFWAVGIGMFVAAFHAGASESIRLSGNRLEVNRKLGPVNRTKVYQLSPEARADVALLSELGVIHGSNNNGSAKLAVGLYDVDGKPIAIGQNASAPQRRDIAERINAYLRAQAPLG